MSDLSPAVALLWSVPWLALPRLATRRPRLDQAPMVTGPSVSVVVPARNEAGNIAALLDSLRASTYDPLEIIVVDDRSGDGTGAIARRAAGGDPRVRVITGEEPPPGWFGKPWACLQGYLAAQGDLVLFTDADTRHRPEALSHAVGALTGEHADLVTIITGQDLVSFWERVVMPHFLVPLAFRYRPERINLARRARDVIANGQFILVRREAYEQAGTHAVVKGDVAEDLGLALAFHRAGLRIRAAHAEKLVRTRMYTGLAGLVEGWSKNLFVGGRASYPDEPVRRFLLPVGIALSCLYWMGPSVWLLLDPGLPAALAFGLAAGFWAAAALGVQIPPAYGLLHALGAAVMLFITVRSTWRGHRRVEWRGRVYAIPD